MRGFHLLALLASVTLAGCGEEYSEEEQRAQNAASADEVRAANDSPPPLEELFPEPIEPAEVEANDLVGMACSYAPGTSGAVRLIAREIDAVVKLDGELVRFAADPGSRKLPANTRTLYNGMEFALRLDLNEQSSVNESGGKAFEGTIWIYDRWDRVIYTGTGPVTCGA